MHDISCLAWIQQRAVWFTHEETVTMISNAWMQDLIDQIKRRQWGIIILDEVHLSFAKTFWQVRSHSLPSGVMHNLHACI
jgi:superfamily II DNA or RNA helicase